MASHDEADPSRRRPAVPLVLASASPRRAALLREHGYAFSVVPAAHAEPDLSRSSVAPACQAEALSYFKARSVADHGAQGVILAADTIAARGRAVFGKAADADEARRILTALAGTTHEVITGVTLLSSVDSRRRIAHFVTRVSMRRLSAAQLNDYLARGEWQGKAGAYGIQDANDPFVERIDGSFTNVVGLPMEMLAPLYEAFVKRAF